MHRPIVRSTTLAAALAAELAVGTLLVAPAALADDTVVPSGDPGAPSAEPEVRTGFADDAPPPEPAPLDVPEAPAEPVRSGRVGYVPLDAVPSDHGPAEPPGDSPSSTTTEPAPQPSDAPSGSGHTPATGDPATGGPQRDLPASPDGTPSAPVPTAPPLPAAHTVVPGDNLWQIAAAQVALATGRARADLGALDIAPYWTQVCLVNRPHVRSGDVSLIYAGEVIELPPL